MNRKALSDAIKQGLTFLSKEQTQNGNFISQSSHDPNNFTDALSLHTTFSTSFILSSLSNLSQTKEIKKINQRASRFLLKQKSTHWSFNYWTRNAKETKTYPYPDDLDDTFCALSALFKANQKIIDGEALAHSIKLLTKLEIKEGGPYRTWLVGETSSKIWKDVDLAVNSNIAYFLSLNGIFLPSLTKFIESKIKMKKFVSPYYPSFYPIIYFISRFYKGKYESNLRHFLLSKKEKNETWGNALDTALAISSLLNMQYPPENLTKSVLHLMRMQQNGAWKAYGFCYDPSRSGKKYFSGSQALTTTFCLEAINKYQQSLMDIEIKSENAKRLHKQEKIYSAIMQLIDHRLSLFDIQIKKQAHELIARLTKKDNDRQIPLLPYFFSESLATKKSFSESLLINLGAANLFGWIAYTIYDNFLDDESDPKSLPLANIALREVTKLFQEIQPQNKEWQIFFHSIIDEMEETNCWEIINCRIKITNDTLSLNTIKIPHYGSYQKLAKKSLGHGLGPFAILFSLGYSGKSPEIKTLLQFFKHYLIAKQLSDDAHDWEKDLAAGQINPICAMILQQLLSKKRKNISLKTSFPSLQKIFWEKILEKTSRDILRHTTQAKKTLYRESFIHDRTFFETLLSPYENGAKNAIKEKTHAVQFMKIYNNE